MKTLANSFWNYHTHANEISFDKNYSPKFRYKFTLMAISHECIFFVYINYAEEIFLFGNVYLKLVSTLTEMRDR